MCIRDSSAAVCCGGGAAGGGASITSSSSSLGAASAAAAAADAHVAAGHHGRDEAGYAAAPAAADDDDDDDDLLNGGFAQPAAFDEQDKPAEERKPSQVATGAASLQSQARGLDGICFLSNAQECAVLDDNTLKWHLSEALVLNGWDGKSRV